MIDTHPAEIVVFCDVCGDEIAEDYLVADTDDSTTRLGYAREHVRSLGWRCDYSGDFCPLHS